MLRSTCGRILMVAVVALAACGGGGGDDDGAGGDKASTSNAPSDEEPAIEVNPSQALSSAGDAPAAQGSGLTTAPGDERTRFGEFGEVAVAVTTPDGEVLGWCLLLADKSELRQRGLMEVTDLSGYPGMLFVWDQDSTSSFYMRNTPMPLSIAWFDSAGELVSTQDMDPCADVADCPLYPAGGAYRFAVEVPKGKLAELGIEEGSKLSVGGECSPTPENSG